MKQTFLKDDQARFLAQVAMQENINFPFIADQLEITWDAVERALRKDKSFRDGLQAVLQRMKWRFIQQINELATKGAQGKFSPEPKFIQLMIKMIDDGSFLGLGKKDVAAPEDDDELTAEEKKRLGL